MRYTSLPAVYEPPANVLAALREVDPTVDLVYLGLGVWVLGSVKPNAHRARVGQRLFAGELRRPLEAQSMGRFRWARLILQGFRPIDLLDYSDIPSGRVVRDFRYADYRYRHDADAAFEENLVGSDDETGLRERIAVLMDLNNSEGRDIWRHAFGGRRNFVQPGVPWLN